jgi:hypothetical protein
MIDTFGPAFPTTPKSAERLGCTFTHEDVGLTKLDWFAGQALAGFLANPALSNVDCELAAKRAYNHALYMLAERNHFK